MILCHLSQWFSAESSADTLVRKKQTKSVTMFHTETNSWWIMPALAANTLFKPSLG